MKTSQAAMKPHTRAFWIVVLLSAMVMGVVGMTSAPMNAQAEGETAAERVATALFGQNYGTLGVTTPESNQIVVRGVEGASVETVENPTVTLAAGDEVIVSTAADIVIAGDALTLDGEGTIQFRGLDRVAGAITATALTVAGPDVDIAIPLTVGTPPMEISGGTVTVSEGGAITGSSADAPTVTVTNTGTLNLYGGTLEALAGDEPRALVVDGKGAVCTIDGATVIGRVQSNNDGVVNVISGFVDGKLRASGGAINVTTGDGGVSAVFTAPVYTRFLQGVGGIVTDFDVEAASLRITYYATADAARAVATEDPSLFWANVSEGGYVCDLLFAQNPRLAETFFINFAKAMGYDYSDKTFPGPTLTMFGVGARDSEFVTSLRDPSGEVMYESEMNSSGIFYVNCYDVPLEDGTLEDNAMGMGTYSATMAPVNDPEAVFSEWTLGVSQVTWDLAGGALPTTDEGTSAETPEPPTLLAAGQWGIDCNPVRPGYTLSGWTAEPASVAVRYIPEKDTWELTVPREPVEITLTAQWEPDVVAVSRLWNPYNGAHLLTSVATEVATLSDAGWKDEGPAFSEYGSAYPKSTPVTRVYNPFNGDHLYSTSEAEVAELVGYGWQDEGVKFYGSPETAIPVYRLWNSLQTGDGGLGSHLWTADQTEYDTLPLLPPVGAWQQEGTVWYAVSLPTDN